MSKNGQVNRFSRESAPPPPHRPLAALEEKLKGTAKAEPAACVLAPSAEADPVSVQPELVPAATTAVEHREDRCVEEPVQAKPDESSVPQATRPRERRPRPDLETHILPPSALSHIALFRQLRDLRVASKRAVCRISDGENTLSFSLSVVGEDPRVRFNLRQASGGLAAAAFPSDAKLFQDEVFGVAEVPAERKAMTDAFAMLLERDRARYARERMERRKGKERTPRQRGGSQ